VLPGPEQAGPPFQQITPLFGKNSPLIHIFKNSATFPIFHVIFVIFIFETKTEFFPNFSVFSCLPVQISSKRNSAIFQLLPQDSVAFYIYFLLDLSKIAVYTAIWQHWIE
jgi:hypothetical protein